MSEGNLGWIREHHCICKSIIVLKLIKLYSKEIKSKFDFVKFKNINLTIFYDIVICDIAEEWNLILTTLTGKSK